MGTTPRKAKNRLKDELNFGVLLYIQGRFSGIAPCSFISAAHKQMELRVLCAGLMKTTVTLLQAQVFSLHRTHFRRRPVRRV